MKKLVLLVAVLGLVLPVFSAVATPIYANDDVTVRWNGIYNASSPFGLMTKQSDYFLMEFTLGSTAAASATLELNNNWPAGSVYTIAFQSLEYDFDDNTLTKAAADALTGFQAVANMDNVQATGTYTVDITSWYNANLGKTMTLKGTDPIGSGADAPIFDDSENTLGLTVPAIQVVVPEPATLLLLSVGGVLIRRKR